MMKTENGAPEMPAVTVNRSAEGKRDKSPPESQSEFLFSPNTKNVPGFVSVTMLEKNINNLQTAKVR